MKKSAALEIVLALVVLAVAYSLTTGGFASIEKSMVQGGYKDLNPLVEAGEDLPAGEWGKISIHWVLGGLADEEVTDIFRSYKDNTAQYAYCLVVLDDLRAMAIKTADETELARLDAMSEDFWEAEDIYTLSAQDFRGRIEKMSDTQLIEIYDETLSFLGYNEADSPIRIQYLILDTSATPARYPLLLASIAALAVILVAGLALIRSQNKREAVRAAVQTAAGQDDAAPETPLDPGA